MKQVLDRLEEGIVIMNKRGIILYCNKSLKICLDSEEVINMPFETFLKNPKEIDSIEMFLKDLKQVELLSTQGEIKTFEIEVEEAIWEDDVCLWVILKMIKMPSLSVEFLDESLEGIPFPVWVKDLEGKYVYVNERWLNSQRVFGRNSQQTYWGKELLTAECVKGKCDNDFWPRDYALRIAGHEQEVIHKKKTLIYNEHLINQGKHTYITIYRVPLFNNKGELTHIMGISVNVTGAKEAEIVCIKAQERMKALTEILGTEPEAYESYSMLRNIKEGLMARLEAQGLAVLSYNEEAEKLEIEVQYGSACEYFNRVGPIHISKEMLDKILQDDSMWGIKAVKECKHIDNQDILSEMAIKWIGSYPIWHNEDFLGILVFAYHKECTAFFKTEQLMQNICKNVGIVIRNEEISRAIHHNKLIQEEYKNYLDIVTDIRGSVSLVGDFKGVSGPWQKKLGWTPEELLKMRYQDIIHAEDEKRANAFFNDYDKLENGSILTARWRCKSGHFIWLEWTCRLLRHREEIICSILDKTQDKEMEEARMKNQIFSDMSHEFKTPLNIILAMMQLIQSQLGDGTMGEASSLRLGRQIMTVKQNAYRLLRLINNIIDRNRIDAGYYNINLQNHNIVQVVEDITMSVVDYTREKDIEIIFDTEEEEILFACDPDKIERIMLNLLSNAIKYTGIKGKIDVTISLPSMHYVRISVKDNGVGIPEDKLETVFGRFMQLDDSLTKKGIGSGIGLSLVKSLVELHEGRIWVESKINEGTTFIIELPIRLIETAVDEIAVTLETNRVEKCTIEFADIYNLD